MKLKLNPDDRIEGSDAPAPRKRGWLLPLIAWLFGSGAIVGVAILFVVTFFLFAISRDLPSAEVMRNYTPPITTRIHAGDGTLIAEFAKERRLFVPVKAIPKNVQYAFLSAEDKNFYEHIGVDPMGILRAAIANISNYLNDRRMEGASTITQQVAKNMLLTSEVSLDRKIKEALIALRIEQTFTKDEILELYLNEIYLGWRAYGVASAALNYFDKSLDQLTLAEAAFLAVLPKAPNNYNPKRERTRAAAIARRNWVLDRMAANGFISREQATAAKAEDLVVHERAIASHLQEAGYFSEEVRRQLYETYDEDGLYSGGMSVRTTLDTTFQKYAVEALQHGLQLYDRRHGWRGPYAEIDLQAGGWADALDKIERPRDIANWRLAVVLETSNAEAEIGFEDKTRATLPFDGMKWARPWLRGERVGAEPTSVRNVLKPGDVVFVAQNEDDTYELKQIPAVNGGLIAMDPHTGRVLAMVGGFSFDASVFNRATQAMRQPGSSFKPFVYAAALDHGYTPSTVVLDGPLVVDQGPGLPLWKPKNYSSEFYGESTLRTGIEHSRNLMTARLALDIGMDPIVETARKFGIKEDLAPQPAMALGAGETTLYRMVTAYSVLVNGGKRVYPSLIDRIQDRFGNTIERHDARDCPGCRTDDWHEQNEPLLVDDREQVLDERTAYQIVSMLEGAVLRGTGTRMRELGIPMGGKTGTTNDSRDAWFMCVTPDLVAGAYVGFDIPRSLGPRETGGRVALPVVKKFMEQALKDTAKTPFRIPSGIRLVRVNRKSGLLTSPDDPRMILEAFKPGTEPGSNAAPQRLRLEDYDQQFGQGTDSNPYRYNPSSPDRVIIPESAQQEIDQEREYNRRQYENQSQQPAPPSTRPEPQPEPEPEETPGGGFDSGGGLY